MKKIGFLSFGYWSEAAGSRVRSAADSLAQSLELAVAAEEIGIGGAYFRVHHFAQQQSSPFPLLAAIVARTTRIDVGTGVIDMRYESPMYFAEQAASLDLLSAGRVQLGIGRGSPEAADRGYRHFGHTPAPGMDASDMAREHTTRALPALQGAPVAPPNPEQNASTHPLPITPQSPTLHERILWGAGNLESAQWAARHGLGLMSSTLIIDEKGIPFTELQLEQINGFRAAWQDHGWSWRPQITVARSIIPIVDDESRTYFGNSPERHEGVGILNGTQFRYGASLVGEPEHLIDHLRRDVALGAADTVLVTIPSQLGVDFNTRQLTAINRIGKELGWNE